MEPILEAKGLSRAFKGVRALSGMNLSLYPGEVIGLIGLNGAGKTTLLKILSGLLMPSSGYYTLFGERMGRISPRNRRKVATMTDTPSLYPSLSAKENMAMRAILCGMPESEAVEASRKLLEFAFLGELCGDERKVNTFSLGMRRRLAVSMCLLSGPEILLLDEPTNGLDPEGISAVRELLLRLSRGKGVSMVVSSHMLFELSKIATRYVFIDEGRVLESISAEEVERRSLKRIRMKTSEDGKALELLAAAGIKAETEEGRLSVYGGTAETLRAVSNSLKILSFKEEGGEVEDYFLSLLRKNGKDI